MNYPPIEVFEEDKLIRDELVRYTKLPETITNAENLLRKTKPILQKIKSKLGYNNNYYLKMSTTIIAAALHSIIEEVNRVQNNLNRYIPEYEKAGILLNLRQKFESAWSVTALMDSFDMEYEFKQNRYTPNRNTLKKLCDQLYVGASTSTSSSSSDNNWGCIIIGIIIFIIIIIVNS